MTERPIRAEAGPFASPGLLGPMGAEQGLTSPSGTSPGPGGS